MARTPFKLRSSGPFKMMGSSPAKQSKNWGMDLMTNETKAKIDKSNQLNTKDSRYETNVKDANANKPEGFTNRGKKGDELRKTAIDAAVDPETGYLIDPDNTKANQDAGTARFQQDVTDTHNKTKKQLLEDSGKKGNLWNQVFGPSKKKLKHNEIKDARQLQLHGFPEKPIERELLRKMEEGGHVYSGISKGKGKGASTGEPMDENNSAAKYRSPVKQNIFAEGNNPKKTIEEEASDYRKNTKNRDKKKVDPHTQKYVDYVNTKAGVKGGPKRDKYGNLIK
jgi:hypothetical protein